MAAIAPTTVANITGTGPMTSLAAAVATGAGQAFQLATALPNWAVQINPTAATFSVNLQGSLDGVNWANIGSAITSAGLTFYTGQIFNYVQLNVNSVSGGSLTGIIAGAA